jgi:hypothetical protein
MIGGGLPLVALILFVLLFAWRRPRRAARPPLQVTRPTGLLGMLRQGTYDQVIGDSEQTLKVATDTLHHGSRPALLGVLALAAVMGLIAGRRL